MSADAMTDVEKSQSGALTRLVSRASGVLANRIDRRGFLTRGAVVGSALAVSPLRYVLRPVTAYAAVCNCSGYSCDCGSACCDGYTEFCCTLTGQNSCPPGTAAGGWWKADAPGLCGDAPRYYMDCNVVPPATPCGCGCALGDCNHRKACCTQFRYGQCHMEIPVMGPIMCRVVTCAPPWDFDPSCTTLALTDNNTRWHDAGCLHPQPIDGWESLGGQIVESPACASWGPGRFDVFATGTDEQLWHRGFAANAGWSGWNGLGGVLTSGPAASSWGPGRLDVVARGSDGAVHHRAFEGSWSSWEHLGGDIVGSPAGVSWAPGRYDVFATGVDGQLWHKAFELRLGWSGWAPLGGRLASGPAASSPGPGRIDVVAQGADGAVHHRWFNGAWSQWEYLGGEIVGSPAGASWSAGRYDIFGTGVDGQLWHRSQTVSRGWSAWESWGGELTSGPSASTWGPGRLDVVARGSDEALWHRVRVQPV
jgi:hypothetical protein